MIRNLALLSVCVSCFYSMSVQAAQFFYSRDRLSIMRASLPAASEPLPWQTSPVAPEPLVTIDVDVKDGASLYQQNGWFELSALPEGTGMVLVFDTPKIMPLTHLTQYTALDILFIDGENKISQIMPNMLLSAVDHKVSPEKPAKAVLLLQAKSADHLSIHIGDTVQSTALAPVNPAVVNVFQDTPKKKAAVKPIGVKRKKAAPPFPPMPEPYITK